MRRLHILVGLACLLTPSVHCAAQGTFQFTFTAEINGATALPPNESWRNGSGSFGIFDEWVFFGSIAVEGASNQGNVAIYSSISASSLGTHVFTFTPGDFWAPDHEGGPGGRIFDAVYTFSEAERADLLAGHWWAVYITPEFPNGELRGQIVPEPSTIVLLLAGSAGLLAYLRHSKRGKRVSGS